MADTLTELSQRPAAFWLGLGLFLAGVLLAQVASEGGVLAVAQALRWLGLGILALRLVVGIYRIFRTSARSGVAGYEEGKGED
jgi:hypothetical protein